MIDDALEGLTAGQIYMALSKATRVPPGKGMFLQRNETFEATTRELWTAISALMPPPEGKAAETEEIVRGILERAMWQNYAGAQRLVATPFRVPRLSWDPFFMLHAALAATRSTCDRGPELLLDPGRHGVGAVIVRENRIIAGGYNGSPPGEPHCDLLECPVCEAEYDPADFEEGESRTCPGCGSGELEGGHLLSDGHCTRTLHAEENALLQCALDGTSPRGGTVYTTASPCWDCSKRLVRVGVERVVYGDDSEDIVHTFPADGAPYESRYGMSKEACGMLRRADVRVDHLDLAEHLRRGAQR